MPANEIKAEEGFSKITVYRKRLSIFITIFLGVVLLSAGLIKGSHMGLFVRQIKAYGLISQPMLVFIGAWFLIAFECVMGAGLIARYRIRVLLGLTFGLFIIFFGATTWAWLAGTTQECGCFGPWMKHSPAEEVIQNLFILVLVGIAFFSSRDIDVGSGKIGLAVVSLAFLAAFLMPLFTGLPLPEGRGRLDIITERQGVKNIEVYGIEGLNLSDGLYLVVLMQTDCQHCKESIPQMEMLSDTPGLPRFVALCPDDEEERKRFIDEFRPVFPLGRINEEVFLRLLGNGETPRLLFLQDGIVRDVWDGGMPGIEIVKKAISLKNEA